MLSTELTNKTVLLLTGAFILIVFMDIQAARHMEAVSGPLISQAKEVISEEDSSLIKGFDTEAVLRPVKQNISSVIEEYQTVTSGTAGKVSQKAGDLTKKAGNALTGIQERIFKTDTYYLYYIRFNGGRSELVRVERRTDGKLVTLKDVLTSLQEGPSVRERGLLNTFDSRVKILGADLKNGILEINVSGSFDRNGARIVQDRLDQLILTLSQFPEVRGVKLFIDGKPASSLADSEIKLGSILGPPARRVESY